MDKIIDILRLSEFKEKIISLIPTKVSQLDNDSAYATQTEVDNLKKSVSDGKELVADAITEKGVTTAADATFATIAENIGQITTKEDVKLQIKTVEPATVLTSVYPDEGYNGLKRVDIQAMNILLGEVFNPSTTRQLINPYPGFVGFGQFQIEAIKLQSKTITPKTSSQIVKADSGYNGLSQVVVNAQANTTPKSVTLVGTVTASLLGVGSKSKDFTKTISLPISSTEALGSSSMTGSTSSNMVSASVKITGISFEQSASISMIAEHFGVDEELAEQIYDMDEFMIEVEEGQLESLRIQKISEAIMMSEKTVIKDEKLVSGAHDTVIDDTCKAVINLAEV